MAIRDGRMDLLPADSPEPVVLYGVVDERLDGPSEAGFISRSVLQQQIDGGEQRPTQLTVDRVLLALIQWIILPPDSPIPLCRPSGIG